MELTITTLCKICTLIELYHLFFYDAIMKQIKPVMEIYKACDHFEQVLKSGNEMVKIARQNKYLKILLLADSIPAKNIEGGIPSKNAKNMAVSAALKEYIKDNPYGLIKFVITYIIEIVYWGFLMVLCCKLDNIILGVGVLILSLIFSCISGKILYSEKYGKYWNCFNVADSTFFIILYMTIHHYLV